MSNSLKYPDGTDISAEDIAQAKTLLPEMLSYIAYLENQDLWSGYTREELLKVLPSLLERAAAHLRLKFEQAPNDCPQGDWRMLKLCKQGVFSDVSREVLWAITSEFRHVLAKEFRIATETWQESIAAFDAGHLV